MPKQRVGRKKRSHEGVKVLLLSDGRRVARWKDPLSGRTQQVSLDRMRLTTDASRREWARQKAEQLAEMRRAVTVGSVRTARTTVRQAVEDYLNGVKHKATRESKRLPLESLAERLEGQGAADMATVAGPVLMAAWRDWVTSPRSTRAPGTQNRWLAVSGSFLRWARRRGMAPMLTLEGIADTCERVPQPVEEIEFLTPAQIREVLTAARAQDLARRRKTAPLVLGLLLSGCRLRELANLPWREVEDDGIRIEAARVKTRRGRVVGFAESPMLRRLIEAQRTPESKPDDLVWPGVVWSWDLAVRRMVQEFGAPPFTAHTLRRTCGTLLTCAPGIFGGASAFMSAKRLGHSVEIAERLYAGTLRDLPADAKTLEAAAGITDLAESICSDAEGGGE